MPSAPPSANILSSTKTFRSRLIDVVDQAQHFAVLGPASAGGSDGDGAQTFREGLDATERESKPFRLC
jgi:GINS complex subunit 3